MVVIAPGLNRIPREQEPLTFSGYTWDALAGQYRSDRTGRLVSRERVLELVERTTQEDERRQQAAIAALFLGAVALSVWYARSSAMLRRQYLRAAALAAGGWGQLDAGDLAAITDALGPELRYLLRLGEQIAAGEVTERQAANRMNMYVGHGRQQFFTVERARLLTAIAAAQKLRPGTVVLERRRLDPSAENCPDCIRYHDQGWQPAGTLPLPTEQSVCDGNCRCDLQQREVPAAEVGRWIGHRSRQGEVAEYDPMQPRGPKGSPRGGQWIATGNAGKGIILPATGARESRTDLTWKLNSHATELDTSDWPSRAQGVARGAATDRSQGYPCLTLRDEYAQGVASYETWTHREIGPVLEVRYLASSAQVKGTGTALMTGLARIASSEGRGMWLMSVPGARGFYEKLGFEHDGNREPDGRQAYRLTAKQTVLLAEVE